MIYTIPAAGGVAPGVAAGAYPVLWLVLAWIAAINVVAFCAFGLDKWLAQRGAWRISERRLLTMALVGGSAGAIAAQRLFRHKTRKEPFRTQLLGIVVLQVIAAGVLAVPTTRTPVLVALGVQ